MYSIYALVDPRTSHTRYVGCTTRPAYRLSAHACCHKVKSGSGGTAGKLVREWIGELREQGFRPVMVILQQVEDKQVGEQAETFWILHFEALGAELLNVMKTVKYRKKVRVKIPKPTYTASDRCFETIEQRTARYRLKRAERSR